MTIDSARGYAIHDVKDYHNFQLTDYKLKTEEPEDVTIHIECCGTCGSDHHTISGGWGPLASKFCVTGHEIVGTVVQLGPEVKDLKLGQRVGVGAMVKSCMKCKFCLNDNENYCPEVWVDTYNSKYPNGEDAQGGYSTHIRAHQHFVFPLPEGLRSVDAASMLCAGATSYSPLVRHNVGKGSKVGIVGLGGLGHYGLIFAKALGAEVTVFSHSERKKDDALAMGADHFVITNDGFEKSLGKQLDIIVCTASSSSLPLNELVTTLTIGGHFVFVGMPEGPWPQLTSQAMAGNGAFVGSSHIGSRKEILQMFELAVKHDIKPWVTTRPMKEASESIKDVETGKARYRTILIQDIDREPQL